MFRYTVVILIPVLVTGCSGNIPAVGPFGAALSGCSIQADAKRMLPEIQEHSHTEWTYPISRVHVIGPVKSSIPPPILAATFGNALKNALRQSGALESGTSTLDKNYILTADIISQNRHGTFSLTSLELTIKYTLHLRDKSDQILWESVITTTSEIKDWKTDACKRLRNLQEELSKQNIRRLLDRLPTKK